MLAVIETVSTRTHLVGGRIDALPENIVYHDTGCSFHPACLTCPLPVCRYDVDAGASKRMRNGLDARDAEIRRLHAAGVPVNAIANGYGISRRTVFRVTAR